MRRGKPLRRGKGLARRSERKIERGDDLDVSAPVRQAVLRRAQMRCERCGAQEAPGLRLVLHHRLRRAHSGPHSEANLVVLCETTHGEGGCHRVVHANPAVSYGNGLLIPSWEGPPTEPWRKLPW